MTTKKTEVKVTDLVRNGKSGDVVTLTTGIKVKFNVAPSLLIEHAASSVPAPKPPVQDLGDGRKAENPNHPDYLEAQKEWLRNQSQAAIDVMIAFVDLVDGLPEDNSWTKRLRYLERLKHIDLGSYDLEDPEDREFIYKKYVAFGNADLEALGKFNGISEEDRALARSTFQG